MLVSMEAMEGTFMLSFRFYVASTFNLPWQHDQKSLSRSLKLNKVYFGLLFESLTFYTLNTSFRAFNVDVKKAANPL